MAKRPSPNGKEGSSTENATPSAKRFKLDYSNDLITVLVGESEKEFVVHKSILCKASKFFQAACSKSWKEGQERTIRLPEADTEAFNVYTHWLYSGTMETSIMTQPPNCLYGPTFLNLGKLWILGSFLNDHIFMNLAIDRFLQKFDSYTVARVSARSLKYIWELTPPRCGVQRLLSEVTVARLSYDYLEFHEDLIPRDILLELAKRYASGEVKKTSPTFADRCNYHVHEGEEKKCH